MSICDKCEQIWKDAYETLGEKKKKEYKVYVLCEYHRVKCVYERTEKHVAGSQSKSPETCLSRLSGPSAWGQSPGAAGRTAIRTICPALTRLPPGFTLSLLNVQTPSQPPMPNFILLYLLF